MSEATLNPVSRKVGAFEKRIHEVDLVRGILILIVLMDHLLNCFYNYSSQWYDITGNEAFLNLFKNVQFYWFCDARTVIRYVALFLFCFVSGLSCAFSRNNWKRAGEMILIWGVLAMGFRLFYYAGVAGGMLDFNIIGVLAFSTLVYCFVQKFSYRVKIASTLLLFIIAWYVVLDLAVNLSEYKANVPIFFDPASTGNPQYDWMPLFPYIFFFFLGATATEFLYKEKKAHLPRKEWERPICFVGRHTLIIYLGHMVVFLGIFTLITEIMKATHGA